MILPILLYGHPVLRKETQEIPFGTNLNSLIDDMFETMHAAKGVGLAAPQIGQSIRLFIVNGAGIEDEPHLENFKKVFINPEILEETGEIKKLEEGCLSIPSIREDVSRPESLRIHYFDAQWNAHEEVYTGFATRIIQHEYDHLEGILFVDHLSALKKKLLKARLTEMAKGKVEVEYKYTVYKKR